VKAINKVIDCTSWSEIMTQLTAATWSTERSKTARRDTTLPQFPQHTINSRLYTFCQYNVNYTTADI